MPDALEYYRAVAPALLINAGLDIREKQFDRARASLSNYISVRADEAEPEFLMAETYRKQAPDGPDFISRTEAYNKTLQKDSAYAAAHKELGMAYRLQRQNVEAKAAFERYLELAAAAPDAGIIRGYLESL